MLEPIPFWGMIEVDLPVKTYAGNKANYIREDMNNEPIAWMVNNQTYKDIFEAEHYSKFTNKPIIPLYTHPANVDSIDTSEQYVDKSENNRHDLTAEDCECLEGLMGMYWDLAFKEGSLKVNLSEQANDVLNSFRAILRKAQEK